MVVFYRPISRSLPLSRSLARRIINTDTDTNRNWPGRSPWNGENSRRVNLNFFYCVLTCHTCDHAIKVSRFLFSPFHPQTEKDRHVWEIATCAFLIIPRYFLLARIITPAHVTVPSPYAIFHSARAFLPPFFSRFERMNTVRLYIIRIGKFS